MEIPPEELDFGEALHKEYPLGEVPNFQAPFSRWAREARDSLLPFPFPGRMENAAASAALHVAALHVAALHLAALHESALQSVVIFA